MSVPPTFTQANCVCGHQWSPMPKVNSTFLRNAAALTIGRLGKDEKHGEEEREREREKKKSKPLVLHLVYWIW